MALDPETAAASALVDWNPRPTRAQVICEVAQWLLEHAHGRRADFYAPSKSGGAALTNAAAALIAGKMHGGRGASPGPDDGAIQHPPQPRIEPRVEDDPHVIELVLFADRALTALLAILSLPWNGGMANLLVCPCCRALFLSDGTPESHRPGCAWLIAAQACGVA